MELTAKLMEIDRPNPKLDLTSYTVYDVILAEKTCQLGNSRHPYIFSCSEIWL